MIKKIKMFLKARRDYYKWLHVWCDYQIELDKQIKIVAESDDIDDLIRLRNLARMTSKCWYWLKEYEHLYKFWKKQ